MGRTEPVVHPATSEDKEVASMMRRLLTVFVVMAIMAAMVAVMAAPAFAISETGQVARLPFGYCVHGQALLHGAQGGPGVLCITPPS
jgi:uncharacterized cupredoxin-like copper-binding protein